MTIYIAGPIAGNPNYKAEFARVERRLKNRGHVVLNPAMLPEGLAPEACLAICSRMLDVSDAVYLLRGWERSADARDIYALADFGAKDIIFEAEDAAARRPA